MFPILEGIYVLLARTARNYALEFEPVKALVPSDEEERRAVENTLRLLESEGRRTTWEWEDEAFWAQEYGRQLSGEVREKNWNDRLWPRERLVGRVLDSGALRGKAILDVGCGEGQNFRGLLAQYCDEASTYIGVDITLVGLRLNRQRNRHANSIYVLASANSLPFADASVDVLCYWGILHHTERRAATVAEDVRLLRDGGYVFLHEALDRPSFLPSALKPHEEESAHEERIPLTEIRGVLAGLPSLRIVAWSEMHTAFYTGLVRVFGHKLAAKRGLFWFATNTDSLLVKVLGRVLPFMRAGTLMMAARWSRPRTS